MDAGFAAEATVPQSVYESAVNGRREFRAALREERARNSELLKRLTQWRRAAIAIVFLLALAILAVLMSKPAGAATLYVRTDGGTKEQCNGLANVSYSANGFGASSKPGTAPRACAWAHPFIALPPASAATGQPTPPRIHGGDTLIIGPGSYMLGYGAPETGGCTTTSAYNCTMGSPPAGPDPGHPTQIYGDGWNTGCKKAPELWGTQRAAQVLQVRNTANVKIACLDITDHDACIEQHCNAGGCVEKNACKRDEYPFGTWAENGIGMNDATNVTFDHVRIHGLGNFAVYAGRVTNMLWTNFEFRGNGWGGFSGDIGAGVADTSFHGTATFQNGEVDWNGCGERWPSTDIWGCWAQETGGYGDGVGFGKTSGNILFSDISVHDNTSDGLDALYADGTGQVTFRRVHAWRNAGNQLKAQGPTLIEDSLVASQCASAWSTYPPAGQKVDGYVPNSARGLFNMHESEICRANGDAIATRNTARSAIVIRRNTITTESGGMVVNTQASNVDARTSTLLLANNILDGNDTIAWLEYATSGVAERTFGYYAFSGDSHGDNVPVATFKSNVFWKLKADQMFPGNIAADPRMRDNRPWSLDPRLLPDSPARAAGDPANCSAGLATSLRKCDVGYAAGK